MYTVAAYLFSISIFKCLRCPMSMNIVNSCGMNDAGLFCSCLKKQETVKFFDLLARPVLHKKQKMIALFNARQPRQLHHSQTQLNASKALSKKEKKKKKKKRHTKNNTQKLKSIKELRSQWRPKLKKQTLQSISVAIYEKHEFIFHLSQG